MSEEIQFTNSFFISQLSKKVSESNAKLLFDSALVKSGISNADVFEKDQAHSICMALINKGGPSFQVGAQIYKQYLQ